MRCRLCGKTFIKEFDIYNIFDDYICDKCIHDLEEKEYIIPLDNGYLLKVIYYLDELNNLLEREVCKIIKKKYNKKSFHFLNENDLEDYISINLNQNITIISIYEINLEKKF